MTTSSAAQHNPTNSPTNHYDIIVLGVGAMGSAALDQLTQPNNAPQPRRILGIEQFTIGHALGSSHGGSRIIRQSYFEHPDYVPLLRRAYEHWENLNTYWTQTHNHAPLLHLTGGLYISPAESPTYTGALRSAQLHNLPHQTLDATTIRTQFPHLTPQPGQLGLLETAAGYVVPEATIAAQTTRARENGVEILEQTSVTHIQPGHPLTITTTRGTFTADQLIITAGAWAPKILRELRIPLVVERQVMYWLQPRDPDTMRHFTTSPIYIHEAAASGTIYGFPAIDGPAGGCKVAFHRVGGEADPDHLDRTITDAELQTLRRRLESTLPALATGTLVQAKACMYTTTPDEHFVIGRDVRRGYEGVVFACGFSGHGFKFVPVIGEMLARMVLERTEDCGVPMFSPTRFTEV